MHLTRFQFLMGGTVFLGGAIVMLSTGGWRWFLLSWLFTVSGLCVGLGVSFPQWQMFGHSLCRGPGRRKRVALTFDDGPDPETSPELLALLAERGVRVTFFCIGHRVRGAPELVRQMVAGGHRVENHSYAHDRWTNLYSVPRLRADVNQAQQQIQSVTGRAPRFFRPPMGLTNQRVFRVADEVGLRVVGYAARGLDRQHQPPDKIVERLLCGLRPGAILLLHDAGVPRSQLLAVVSRLLDRLRSLGYQCVPLDELVDGEKP